MYSAVILIPCCVPLECVTEVQCYKRLSFECNEAKRRIIDMEASKSWCSPVTNCTTFSDGRMEDVFSYVVFVICDVFFQGFSHVHLGT